MSFNKYQPHILLIPEDDANRQISVGFAITCTTKQLKIEKPAGGWQKLIRHFLDEHVMPMKSYSDRYVVLLLDYDNDPQRLSQVRSQIPSEVSDRVFVLGCLDEPERLKSAGLGSFEEIGKCIARDCNDRNLGLWQHELLKHNLSELEGLRKAVCHIVV